MILGLFQNVSDADKNAAIESIILHATPRQDFFLMLALAVSMAAFGILLDSTVILVGSMLVAPLLYPLLSLSLGIILADDKLIVTSTITVLKSVGYALVAGSMIGFFFSTHDTSALSIFSSVGTASSLMYTLVAVIAGLAAAFAMIKPHLTETLPGVAISVALVPPLAEAGIALSLSEWQIFSNSLLLFLVNVIGIVFSAMIVFALARLAVKRTVAKEALKEEEKVIKKEEKIAEASKSSSAA